MTIRFAVPKEKLMPSVKQEPTYLPGTSLREWQLGSIGELGQ
jgi:hypothetical protein